MPSEAGQGEHNYYLLKAEREEVAELPLQARRHYLGVDAVRWFVNEQGGLFRDRMASGTVQVGLGNEMYEVGLGTYQLEGGERTAPVFDQPILPNRVFLGGSLRFKVFVRAIAQDTLLGGLLRDMAKASLDVVSGAIAAATATGPAALLLTAGSSMVGGTLKILNEAESGITVFDPGGVDVTLGPMDLSGRETYLLLHRGAPLDRDQLSVTSDERGAFEVLHGSSPLDDGAWVLFRLRREDRYGGVRPWEEEVRGVMADLDNLIDQWSFGGITREQAQGSLTPNMNEPPTLGDKLLDLVASIRRDFVLTEVEATRRAGELRSNLRVAQEALEEDDPAVYRNQREAMMSALESGREPPRALAEVFTAEASLVANARIATLSQKDSASPFRDGLWLSLSNVGPAY